MSLASRLSSSPGVTYGLSAGTLVVAASALYVLKRRHAASERAARDEDQYGNAMNSTPVPGAASTAPKIVTRGRAAVNEESNIQTAPTPRVAHSKARLPPQTGDRATAVRGRSAGMPLAVFGVKVATVEQPAMFGAFVALVVIATLGVVGVASSGALSWLRPLLWIAVGAAVAAVFVKVDARPSDGGSGGRTVSMAPGAQPAAVARPAAPAAAQAPSPLAPTAAPASLCASSFQVDGNSHDFVNRTDDLDWYPQDGASEASWSGSDGESDDDSVTGSSDEAHKSGAEADAQDTGVSAVLARVDALHTQREFKQVEALLSAELKQPGNLSQEDRCELCWRLSRSLAARCFDHDQGRAPGVNKEVLAKAGTEYAEQAVAANPNSAAAHKWLAILLGRLGGPTKEVIKRAYKIRDHALRSVELDNSDGTILYVLGYFEYSVASMGYATRAIASALFGSPPQGSYQKALEFFHAAERAEPGFYMANRLMLAKTYLALSDKQQAKHWLGEAMQLPLTPDEAKEDFEEARKLCKKLGVRV